jgi:hypothetical protein
MERIAVLVGSAALIVTLLAGIDRSAADAVVPQSCIPGTWDIQATPVFNRQLEMFGDVAVAPSDVWAVGALGPQPPDSAYAPLALHFDGASWDPEVVPLPNGSPGAMLRGVSGTSPSDVWAVGISFAGNAYDPYPMSALIEHWDGATWSVVPSPPTPEPDAALMDVIAISPSNAWAVGYQFDHSAEFDQTLVEHWDGISWSVVASPNHANSTDYLPNISASSPSNVWALGQWVDEGDSKFGNSIQRWDGTSWRAVKNPFGDYHIPGPGATGLWNVAAISSSNVWFAGYYVESAAHLLPRVVRWDGVSWEELDINATGQLIDITASSAQDVWMLGTNSDTSTSYGEHWDGTRISVFPNPQGQQVQLAFGGSLTALPSGDVWAVGTVDQGAYVQHLCPIRVSDGAGSSGLAAPTAKPVTTTVRQGTGVFWKFLRSNRSKHEVKDSSGMGLFDSGMRPSGGSYTRVFKSAGSYAWKDSVSGKRGIVKVRVTASPAKGSKTTVRWSIAKPPKGFVFDVQVRTPGAKGFTTWKKGVTGSSALFSATKRGTYYFIARLRKLETWMYSGWSPWRAFQRL